MIKFKISQLQKISHIYFLLKFGIKLSLTHRGHINISILYNDPASTIPLKSQILTSFILAFEPNHWINFGIQVIGDRISFYHNCIKIDERNVTREPKELNFESASTFYLAQAGEILREKFEVNCI